MNHSNIDQLVDNLKRARAGLQQGDFYTARIMGHGNAGFLNVGSGNQIGAPDQTIGYWNASEWQSKISTLSGLYNSIGLYGCAVGADSVGDGLVETISQITSANVWAPMDDVTCAGSNIAGLSLGKTIRFMQHGGGATQQIPVQYHLPDPTVGVIVWETAIWPLEASGWANVPPPIPPGPSFLGVGGPEPGDPGGEDFPFDTVSLAFANRPELEFSCEVPPPRQVFPLPVDKFSEEFLGLKWSKYRCNTNVSRLGYFRLYNTKGWSGSIEFDIISDHKIRFKKKYMSELPTGGKLHKALSKIIQNR